MLAALVLLGLFSTEIADPDFWWHLKTGQFVVEHRALPVPDPFAFTTARARDAYPAEGVTRYFNLTHEWLAQAVLYAVYRTGGFAGVVLWRAAMLAAFCALAGWLAYRRSGGHYRGLLAAFAAASVAVGFAADRPFLFTFLFLAVTLAILETRRWYWLLPLLFVVWANSHGGFFLGWIVLAVYSLEGWLQRRDRRLLIVAAVSVLASGLNPNGFRVLPVLLDYRQSFLQSKLLEWTAPRLWPPRWFSVWMAAALIAMLWSRKRVRVADWLLFATFGAAALSAQRNTILLGFLAPILIAAYIPWKRPAPAWARYAAPALLLRPWEWASRAGNFSDWAPRNGAIPKAPPIFFRCTEWFNPCSTPTNSAAT